MKFNVLNRKVHYWGSALVALPLLVVIATGLLLQLKKVLPWVQPRETRGAAKEPTIDFARILEACQGVPEAEVQSWKDIERIDVRPAKGILKVRAFSGWEVQIDSKTGEVLQVAYRRSDVIESLHDGSWFHPAAKYGLFLPAAVVLLVMWLTGVYLFVLPYLVRWRRRGERGASVPSAPT